MRKQPQREIKIQILLFLFYFYCQICHLDYFWDLHGGGIGCYKKNKIIFKCFIFHIYVLQHMDDGHWTWHGGMVSARHAMRNISDFFTFLPSFPIFVKNLKISKFSNKIKANGLEWFVVYKSFMVLVIESYKQKF